MLLYVASKRYCRFHVIKRWLALLLILLSLVTIFLPWKQRIGSQAAVHFPGSKNAVKQRTGCLRCVSALMWTKMEPGRRFSERPSFQVSKKCSKKRTPKKITGTTFFHVKFESKGSFLIKGFPSAPLSGNPLGNRMNRIA